jgi:hypothetical protein
MLAAPPWMLQRRALRSAGRAADTASKCVARLVRPPSDDGDRAGKQRAVLAGLLKFAKCWPRAAAGAPVARHSAARQNPDNIRREIIILGL